MGSGGGGVAGSSCPPASVGGDQISAPQISAEFGGTDAMSGHSTGAPGRGGDDLHEVFSSSTGEAEKLVQPSTPSNAGAGVQGQAPGAAGVLVAPDDKTA